MASGKGNLLLENMSGKLGDEYVIKNYSGKIVIARRPRKYKRTTTELTELYADRFKAAIKHAQSILLDSKLKGTYKKKLKPGQRLYNYLIQEYMMEERRKAGQSIPKKPKK
jgi:hypothetical protein